MIINELIYFRNIKTYFWWYWCISYDFDKVY